MSYAIIPPHMSIDAMRSSGYKDASYALAELIDNSIQAAENLDRPAGVEVICLDKTGSQSAGGRRSLEKVAVFDNASGMSPETLRSALQFGVGTHRTPAHQKGMGKFGMGLPNSSISQCRRADVWTWQNGQTWHTFLDIDKIEQELITEVPEPTPAAFPAEWLPLISGEIEDSGTLVVWSNLDLVRYKQSGALLRNAETIIGRIYRYFINSGEVTIRLASYEQVGGQYINHIDSLVRPSDPLMLMSGTCAPAPYDQTPAFEPFGEPQPIEIGYAGKRHIVTITASICKTATRMEGGSSAIGHFAAKNVGISVVRARRELELNRSFEIPSEPRERWWGIEVSFEPALDDVFGVTNNKQSATEFSAKSLKDDAEAEGLSIAEYRAELAADNDPRLPIYEINIVIESLLETMRTQIKRMREGERQARGRAHAGAGNSAEDIATRALRRRQKKLGETGNSDQDEGASDEERTDLLTTEIEQEGLDREVAREIAVNYVERKIKFLFRHADFPGFSVFDVTSKAGVIIVTINTKHPAQAHLFELLREGNPNVPESPALQGLKLLLTAWARMEDEASGAERDALEDLRGNWGRIARDFMREVDE